MWERVDDKFNILDSMYWTHFKNQEVILPLGPEKKLSNYLVMNMKLTKNKPSTPLKLTQFSFNLTHLHYSNNLSNNRIAISLPRYTS